MQSIVASLLAALLCAGLAAAQASAAGEGSAGPDCPPGAIMEGELPCSAGTVDHYNPGCTGDPQTFFELPCSEDTIKVCGTYGRNEYWDLDWYHLTLRKFEYFDACVQGEGRAQIVIIGPPCNRPHMLCNEVPIVNGRTCCHVFLPPGEYYVFIRPFHVDSNIPCGSRYLLEIHGISCRTAVMSMGWSHVKRLYLE
jgi:hypothetical protein